MAENVLAWGTGAINVDGCRVGTEVRYNPPAVTKWTDKGYQGRAEQGKDVTGRWPANLIHDGSPDVVAIFPRAAGASAPVRGTETSAAVSNVYGERNRVAGAFHADDGSAARFFYCAKADRADRHDGCENTHPTVKPTELMRWLCRLVTPRGGLVLDPFCGSGSTGRGAIAEGFRFVGIELDPDYARIAEARIRAIQPGLSLGKP